MTFRKIRFVALLLVGLCLMMVTSVALAADGYVDTSKLVLRKSASKTSKALQTLSCGDKMTILEVNGDWYKVRYGKYTGYVMSEYVIVVGDLPTAKPTATPAPTATPKPAATTAPTGSSSQGSSSSKVTAAPQSTSSTLRNGDTSGSVLTLQKALQSLGYYTGNLDGIFGKGTENAVRAFQKQNGLTQDGVAGPNTLSALYNGNASSSGSSSSSSNSTKTESLDWFKNGNSAIPRGAVFTVKDVDTGKTFQVRRWAGSSHCDSEPLTSTDTATMKAIYGGSWSWTRRAILVSYNGHVYAASMNGMPHGTSTRDNNFNGHFCIHFTGSKTHGTDRVDEDHQAAVQKALKSTW